MSRKWIWRQGEGKLFGKDWQYTAPCPPEYYQVYSLVGSSTNEEEALNTVRMITANNGPESVVVLVDGDMQHLFSAEAFIEHSIGRRERETQYPYSRWEPL